MSADLLYSDVEESLRGSVRSLLSARLTPESIMARYDGGEDHTPLWKSLAADLGLAALLVPEEFGGAGASAREAAVVMEELGRSVAPVPYFSSAVLATITLVEAGETDLLAELASGDKTAALAVPLSSTANSLVLTVDADNDNRNSDSLNGSLNGSVTSVADAGTADVFVVPVALAEGGMALYLVERGAVTVDPVVSLDMTRPLGDLTFEAASGTRIAEGKPAAKAVESALRHGAALLASEQLGVAQWCLDTTLEYVKGRYQFGRPVGSYQALKHRLADLWLEVGSANAAARYAADCLAQGGDDTDVAVSVAQAYCSDVAVKAAEEAIQLHGGIGMTWEHPAHLYLKRAKADQIAMGTPDQHRAHLAELLDLPAS
ncbi:MAG: acyl-CoA/acyl-ACP dehydrogenase [Propionibacteriales bacterium]|nr:acyl-CoA/acyl-ACP dehydrogenase [Propionibacteriales bacterium]